jgi:hypothetical protein
VCFRIRVPPSAPNFLKDRGVMKSDPPFFCVREILEASFPPPESREIVPMGYGFFALPPLS